MTAPKTEAVPKMGGSYPEPWFLSRRMRLVYRFLLGRPMDNQIRTDSTFWHRARTGYPGRWHRLAGWERAAIGVGGSYVALWVLLLLLAAGIRILWGFFGTPEPGILRILTWQRILLVHAAGILVILTPVGVWIRIRDYGIRILLPVIVVTRMRIRLEGWIPYEIQGRKSWELERVRPVALAAASVLGVNPRVERAREWVTVPRNFRDPNGSPVEIRLPDGFTGADEGTKKRLVSAVSARLGMKDPCVSWSLDTAAPRVELRSPEEPPGEVHFADVRDLLLLADEYRPFVGLIGSAGKALNVEMQADSPHVALSAGPGAGKSTLAKLFAMQALRWGWGVVVCDWKMTEAYKWMEGLPGVRILTELADIHDFGVTVGQEVDERKRKGLGGRARVLVIRDEWNATADLLMAYWQDLRATAEPEERKTMPVKSPALRGFAALDFAGREFGLHDLVIAQRMSARVFNGNADIRECFGIRCLARYTEQTKKMLVGNIKLPRKSNHPGRWTIVAGDDVAVVQAPLITGEEAREFAMGGQENPLTPLSTSYWPSVGQPEESAPTLGDQLPHGAARGSETVEAEVVHELPAPEPRKLSEMVDGLSHLGITHKILKHATNRPEEEFPLPIGGSPNRGYRYDYNAVKEWARRRHARMQAEREQD